MMEKYALSWQGDPPVLHEFLGVGRWSEQDDGDYLALLEAVLADAPAGGFDIISDARLYTMQDATLSDVPAYRMIAEAGGRRFVQVVSRSVIALQASRIIREQGLTTLTFQRAASVEEAQQLLR